jgi:hypothetical protein
MKKTMWVALAAALALALAGCDALTGKDGKVFGSVDWDYSLYYVELGGFPASGTRNTNYEVTSGSYDVYYTLFDGIYYYPGYQAGYPYGSSYYWHSHYTVKAEKGEVAYFSLYLGWNGMSKSGIATAIAPPASGGMALPPAAGARTWTEGGLQITVTNEILSAGLAGSSMPEHGQGSWN